MKYCPQCNKQYSEAWLTFCTDDGSLLREDLSPATDPNWDPRIRETKYDNPSEQQTQWLPRDSTPISDWMPPDERAPMERPWQSSPPPPVERPWQPPPPPPQPNVRSGPPGIAVASLIFGLVGVMLGLLCWMPFPGIIAVILGIIALKQMKTAPDPTGRGLAIAGIVLGSANIAFLLFGILWFALSLAFG